MQRKADSSPSQAQGRNDKNMKDTWSGDYTAGTGFILKDSNTSRRTALLRIFFEMLMISCSAVGC